MSPTSEGPGFNQKKPWPVKTICLTPPPRAEGAQEEEMAITPVADDAPPVSTAPESLTSPPGEEQTRSMEVDDRDDHQPPASPISHREDELLTGDNVVGVEGEMANLTVTSPGGCDGGEEGVSI